MNTLKIKLNPYKDINIASLDDKPLSPYSELNNYMKEPFLCWASKLLEAAEREINDDYRLTVVSGLFEKMFLEGMQNDFDSCVEYETSDFEVNTSTSERYEIVKKLANKYGVTYSLEKFKMPVFTEVQLSLDASLVESVPIEDAKIIVVKDRDAVMNLRTRTDNVIIVLLGVENKVSVVANNYLWEIIESELNTILGSIIDRFVKTPIIADVATRLKNMSENMDDVDKKELSISTEIDAFLSISDLPEIEVGSSTDLEVSMVPDGIACPALRLETPNNNFLLIDGLKISAIAPGSTYIDIYKADENIPFERKKVVTYQNNFVQRIELSVSSSKMGIGKKQQANIVLFPNDAEDIGSLVWSVDDTDIVRVNKDGNITAIAEGKTTITASTTKSSAEICITVLPNISKITLTVEDSTLYVGQTEPISVQIEPKNCFDSSYSWRTSDKSVAIIDKQDNGQSIIRATGIGECVLSCDATEGDCTAECRVSVESTFKKRENAHGLLSLTAVLAIAVLFCSALSFSVGCVPLTIATIISGVLASIKNKSDRFWAFLLLSVAIFITVETLGITNIL